MTPLFARLLEGLDQRLGLKGPARKVADKVFPHHWSFLLGEVAGFALIVLIATGIFLTLFYRPSVELVTYTGSDELYRGQLLPAAFESIIRLSSDVPGGLLIRRIHRGASHLFLAAIVLHLLRVLLTGAFRKPREINYHLGIVLLMLAIGEGFLGYSLPYDSLAGTGIRIAYSELLSLPFFGENVAFWIFGGEFPTGDVIPRFHALHVFILPLAIVGAVGLHLALVARQKHTQFPRRGLDGHALVTGKPLWPMQVAESTTLFLWVGGLLAAAAVLVPWSDVALLGPYRPGEVGNNAQPDWFMFWLEGVLRMFPALEVDLPGVTISGPFIAGMVLPGLIFGALIAYPFIERKVYGLTGEWHVLSNPLDIPLRAAMAVGTFSFVLLSSAAATNDVLSRLLGIPIETMTNLFRFTSLLAPPLLALLLYRYSKRRLARRGESVASTEDQADSRFRDPELVRSE